MKKVFVSIKYTFQIAWLLLKITYSITLQIQSDIICNQRPKVHALFLEAFFSSLSPLNNFILLL